MKLQVQDTVRKETLNIAAGTGILTLIMVGVFALMGQFDATVVSGAVLGFIAAVLDFFLLGLTVQKAAEIQAAHPVQAADDKEETPEDGAEDEDPDTLQEGSKAAPADPETAAAIRKRVQISYFCRRGMLVLFACTGLTPFFNLVAILVPMLFPKFVIMVRTAWQKLHAKG